MSTDTKIFTIGEVAERSGFTTSSLRYYENIGLVTPAARSEAGYRLYDDRGLARLGFIARAKQLGCSLEEITDLVAIWDGERCGPVQQRFHELVTTKIADARRQTAELDALTSDLEQAAAQLAGPAVDGPCDADCACFAGEVTVEARSRPVSLVGESTGPPIACALEPGAMPARLAEWRAVLDQARSRTTIAGGGVRIEFGTGIDAGALAQLAAAEQRCCAFFTFAITVDVRGVGLEVHAPHDAKELLTTLFGKTASGGHVPGWPGA
jgi:DNA-binding transcriptional MerR regulator